jgi:hypothetical protein
MDFNVNEVELFAPMQDQQYKMRAIVAFCQIRREYELLPNNEERQQKWTRFVCPLRTLIESPELLFQHISLELETLKHNATVASLRFYSGSVHGSQGRCFQPPPVALYGCVFQQPAAPPLYGYCGVQPAAAYPYNDSRLIVVLSLILGSLLVTEVNILTPGHITRLCHLVLLNLPRVRLLVLLYMRDRRRKTWPGTYIRDQRKAFCRSNSNKKSGSFLW